MKNSQHTDRVEFPIYRFFFNAILALTAILLLSGIANATNTNNLNPNFNVGSGPNNSLRVIALQPDGKILVGGYFRSFNGVTRYGILRLHANGSIDTSFTPATLYLTNVSSILLPTIPVERNVSAIAIQPDGQILIAGSSYTVNDVFRRGIARLNPNGGLDGSFNPGTGTGSDAVRNLVSYPNGKILISGVFFTLPISGSVTVDGKAHYPDSESVFLTR